MAVYFVTGKLGQGKTLVAVSRIKEKLQKGLPVATNINLNLSAMFNPYTKNATYIRVPDKPTVDDLEALGYGNREYDEEKNGLLVLDECGTWFNARNWSDKSRKAVNDWFLHARKLGWDVLLIVQDIQIVDKQARDALAEHTVFCKRLDKIHIPFIGTFFKAFTGSVLRLPRVHVGRVIYGDSEHNGLLSDRWVYRGNDLFSAYDTKQLFLADYPHGVYTSLSPWHTHGRYVKSNEGERMMKLTRIYWKRFNRPIVGCAGVLLGILITAGAMFSASPINASSAKPVAQTVDQGVEKKSADPEPALADPVDEYADLPPLDETLEGYHIAGYIQKGQQSRIYLQHQSKPMLTHDSHEIALAKYDISSPCAINFKRGNQRYTVTCRSM